MDCPETDVRVLTFDHPGRKNKTGDISRMIHTSTWSQILKEAEKCEVVCANCHMKRENARDNSYKHQYWLKLTEESFFSTGEQCE